MVKFQEKFNHGICHQRIPTYNRPHTVCMLYDVSACILLKMYFSVQTYVQSAVNDICQNVI